MASPGLTAPPAAPAVAPPASTPQAPAPFDLAATRQLAANDRSAALRRIDAHLRQSPQDADARVLRAAILSWQGRYDEARADAHSVLAAHPGHGDAARALVRIEQWSGHPGAMLAAAEAGLRAEPFATELLTARARALLALDRPNEAAAALAALRVAAPDLPEAEALADELRPKLRPWHVALGYLADAFPGADAPSTWHELVARVGRTTPLGPLLARVYGGRRFDRDDAQAELELFPVLRKGTYLDLALAASPWRRFYPSYRAALDGYQALGAGFELTLGYRRLGFASPADLGTAGLAYYTGAWLLSARALVAAGGALSGQVAVRRTFGADLGAFRRGWLGLRYAYGRGAARLEARAEGDRSGRDGHAGGLELVLPSEGLELTLRAGYAAEPLPAGSLRHQVSVAPEVLWRF